MKKLTVVIVVMVAVCLVSAFWAVLFKDIEVRAFEKGKIVGRELGQQSVKGQLLPPIPDKIYRGVVVGKQLGEEENVYYKLPDSSQKGEKYLIQKDGRAVRIKIAP